MGKVGGPPGSPLDFGPQLDRILSYIPDLVLQSIASADANGSLTGTGPISLRSDPRAHVTHGAILCFRIPALADAVHDLQGRMTPPETSTDVAIFRTLIHSTFNGIVKIIANNNGDIVKISGANMFIACFLSPSSVTASSTVLRSLKASVQIRQLLRQHHLQVQSGIGFGSVHLMHVGGVGHKLHHVVAGDALLQSLYACHAAPVDSSQIILHCSAKDRIRTLVQFRPIVADDRRFTNGTIHEAIVTNRMLKGDPFLIDNKRGKIRKTIAKEARSCQRRVQRILLRYLGELAVMDLALPIHHDQWWMGRVVQSPVVIASIGVEIAFRNGRDGHQLLQQITVLCASRAINHDAQIIDINVEPSFIVIIIGFGLPPSPVPDRLQMTQNAIEFVRSVSKNLDAMGMRFGVGVDVGEVRCGSIGSVDRRFPSVQGSVIGSATRLMTVAMASQFPMLYGRTMRSALDAVKAVTVTDHDLTIPCSTVEMANNPQIRSKAHTGVRFIVDPDYSTTAMKLGRSASQARQSALIMVEVEIGDDWCPLSPWIMVMIELIDSRSPGFDPIADPSRCSMIADAVCSDLCPEMYQYAGLLNDILGLNLDTSDVVRRFVRGSRDYWSTMFQLVQALIASLIRQHPRGYVVVVSSSRNVDAASLAMAQRLEKADVQLLTIFACGAEQARELNSPAAVAAYRVKSHDDFTNMLSVREPECVPLGSLSELLLSLIDEPDDNGELLNWIGKVAGTTPNPVALTRICAGFIRDDPGLAGVHGLVRRQSGNTQIDRFLKLVEGHDDDVYLFLVRQLLETLSDEATSVLVLIAVLGPSVPYASLSSRAKNPATLWRNLSTFVDCGILFTTSNHRYTMIAPQISALLLVSLTSAEVSAFHYEEIHLQQMEPYCNFFPGTLVMHLAAIGTAESSATLAELLPDGIQNLNNAVHAFENQPINAESVRESPFETELEDGDGMRWKALSRHLVRRVPLAGWRYGVSSEDGTNATRAVFAPFKVGSLSWPLMHTRKGDTLTPRPVNPRLLAYLINKATRVDDHPKLSISRQESIRLGKTGATGPVAKPSFPPAILTEDQAIPCNHYNERLSANLQCHVRPGIQIRVVNPSCTHRSHHRIANCDAWMPRSGSLLTGGCPIKYNRNASLKTVASYMLKHKSSKPRSFKRAPESDVTVEVRLLKPTNYYGWRMRRPKSKLNLLLCGVE